MRYPRLKILLIAIYLSSCSAQFVDEFQDFDTACYEEGAFFCLDGGCVSSDKYCNGMYDCSDGSDENFCTSHTADAQYCNETHQYLCADSRKCVPAAWVCNNETDCDDGSDETNCTSPHVSENSTCKGFLCDGTRCISTLWMCDGKYDCDDRSDEDIHETCRHALHGRKVNDALNCPSIIPHDMAGMEYPCLDVSFCIPLSRMCDGLIDCRDGSDEGPFCTTWHTMCSNHSCGGPDAFCVPQREGPVCQCPALRQYSPARARCESADQCARLAPVCSHACLPRANHFTCQCDDGYIPDYANYLCFAPDPEPILFFSTRNDIRYIKVHSKQQGIITSEVRKAHGVSFDGNYVYWVETAQGHQAITRAHFDNIAETKQVIAALGLMEPADVAVDHLGNNIYLSDSDGQAILVCGANGSACMTLPTKTTHPRFVTLNHRKGEMYWADWIEKPIINMARMDGKDQDYLVHDLESFATGLALDAPNDRLYYVDQTIRVVRLSDKKVYTLFDEPFHHPYALAVFESTVFWSDWTSNTIQTADKIHGSSTNRHILLNLDVPVFDMHIYHPVLMNRVRNPCEHHACSHLCLVTGPETHVCGCPNGMELRGDDCQNAVGYHPRYLVVGAGAVLTRIQYDSLGSADASKVYLDISRLQAMAHDNTRDILYIYDGRRKTINYINMSNFMTGFSHLFMYEGMENVIDMDYDFVSDNLYVLDVTRRVAEVISVRNKMKAFVYFFKEEEIPISMCVIPQYGMMLVAVMENEDTNIIYVDSMGLDGSDRKRFPLTNLEGPYIRMRYSPEMDLVYFSDEGRRVIEQIHPSGTGREIFKQHVTGVASLSVSDTHVFWADRRTNRLYWAHPHDATHKIRRLELTIYPNVTHLHTQVASPPPDTRAFKTHKCFATITPCSHICVQKYHSELAPRGLDYRCLCPAGLFLANDRCVQKANCSRYELYCHKSNTCFSESKKCDGIKDCEFGEDEIGCPATTESHVVCDWDQINCHGTCISGNAVCKDNIQNPEPTVECGPTEQRCGNSSVCVQRVLTCDGHADCPDGSDELPALCGTLACFDTEFMCDSGSCIPVMWRCDRSEDCPDGSDEIGCTNSTCEEGSFACGSGECVELARRCDDQLDCADGSDEDDCAAVDPLDKPEPASACMPWEFVCEHNKTICLPYTARCNAKVDCPGGSDEDGCDLRCAPSGGFGCKQEYRCIGLQHVCNGWRDCTDGSDETLEACAKVNKTGMVLRSKVPNDLECRHGYRCNTSQCIDWSQVCDSNKDCTDGSDENGLCSTPCSLNCSHSCRRSPLGEQCTCPAGYQLVNTTCVDVDECANRVCSHVCHNLPGSFACSCYWGYVLRPDRRSCKAPRGEMTALYADRGGVWALSRTHFHHLVYSDPDNHTVSDLAYNVRKEKMYIASYEGEKLVEVIRRIDTNLVLATNVISNVGRPTKLSVDWVTDNVYFVDGSPTAPTIRVCHVVKKRCAKLKRLTPGTNVTALAVDPANHRLFYCITDSQEAIVRATNLSGRTTIDLAAVPSCAGLAVNSFSKTLYIASPKSSAILQINYEGNTLLTVLNVDPHIRKPHSLALFEDYIYFISSSNLNRCQLFGTKRCTTYGKTQAEPTAFVIHHESTQRDDVKNGCYGFACPNLCVLGERGPTCVCQDGSALKAGLCPVSVDSEMPMFNGRLQTVSRSHPVSTTLVVILVLLFAVYLAAFVRYQRKQRKNNSPGHYLQVRYDNAAGSTQVTTPIVEMSSTSATGHEFINPLQFVRDVWRDSFYGKPTPVGTAGLVINLHQDLSDTESDLDVRETRRLFNNKL